MQNDDIWTSLEELPRAEPARHPESAAGPPAPMDRRSFMRLMGASMALATASGCTSVAREQLLPYVDPPEGQAAGEALHYATVFEVGGVAAGVRVKTREGRPIHIEPNTNHPASVGGIDILTQASLLDLYDPNRARAIHRNDQPSDWTPFLDELRRHLHPGGRGLRILTGAVSSPTLRAQLDEVARRYPEAKWHQWEPMHRDEAMRGAHMAFGDELDPLYHFERAEVVVGIGADFMAQGPGHTRWAHDFMAQRKVRHGTTRMSRYYAAEAFPTISGTVADHRHRASPTEIQNLAAAIGAHFELDGPHGTKTPHTTWLQAVIDDLEKHRGRSLVIVGDDQPAWMHAMAYALNVRLGNVGQTVEFIDPVVERPGPNADSIGELADDLVAGKVEALLVFGGDPAYTAPAELDFGQKIGRAAFSMHLSEVRNATSKACVWHVPRAHYLERWSDSRAFDGTLSVAQPATRPLYQSYSAQRVLAGLLGEGDANDYDLVRRHWQRTHDVREFERFWRATLARGMVAGSRFEPRSVTLKKTTFSEVKIAGTGGLELCFRPDPALYDGRSANNSWLLEIPRPITKLTWGNAAHLSPKTARDHDLHNGDVVRVKVGKRSVNAPVWIVPGQADQTVVVHLGFGQTTGDGPGHGVGFDAYRLRTAANPWTADLAAIESTGDTEKMASTQEHHRLEARSSEILHRGTLAEFRRDEHLASGTKRHEAESLYPPRKDDSYRWAMVIDQARCIGCNACVIACQSENNIPTVGKGRVAAGREMHWLRIDQYFAGSIESPQVYNVPMPCMQCEDAPCEVVCPVGATTHSSEGLNEMTYNRCIGTRYCSNNCPYKVRRFNFFEYDTDEPLLRLRRNPDVTVRDRGVMEKCTYCVQRINGARHKARAEHRKIRRGEVQTACQVACPTDAIVFGDLSDAGSEVARLHAEPHDYAMLAEMNTRPRTTYLAHVSNPNPKLSGVDDD